MRLAVTADLHLPITPAAKIATLAQEIADFVPDALVVAGDVGESVASIEGCLEILKQAGCPVFVLLGNHDLWARDAPSRRLWEEVLPDVVSRCGCVWLEADALVRRGVAVTGTIAWYDYSGADPTVQATRETFAREKGHYNNDAFLINWPWSDPEFAERVAGPFLAKLDQLEADPAVQQIIVVTHVPVLECQMSRQPNDRDWAFSNAYFGNITLGQKIAARRKVTHVISGHTHVGRAARLPLPDGRTIEARVLDSHYERPVWMGITTT
ncbi:MAG: metallophosphoesterase [Planctomycetes bacterium]|nr:metallophosphoesterase [Planctomycetota bacterium]